MNKPLYKNFIILFTAFFLLLFYVWLQIASERLGYKVEKLRIKLNEEMETNKQFKIKVNELSSPDRLYRAGQELKLKIPSKSQVVEIISEE